MPAPHDIKEYRNRDTRRYGNRWWKTEGYFTADASFCQFMWYHVAFDGRLVDDELEVRLNNGQLVKVRPKFLAAS